MIIDLMTVLAETVQANLRPAVLTFLRVGAAMAVLPAFGEQSVPTRIRLVIALAFTGIVAPSVAAEFQGKALLLPAFAEVCAGLLLGLMLRIMVLALQTAAAIAAQSASLSQLFAGAGAEPQPALGTLFTIAALALAVQAGLHVKVAQLLIHSYTLLPAGHLPAAADVAQWGVTDMGRAMALAFSLAAPFVIASVLWNVALGVVNRAMPQLMVSFIGAPALALGGLILTAITTPFILALWLSHLDQRLAQPFAQP